uniref:Uncharacterized protein n=1 Tax=Knipowitschia caucasica TaxID=637954 RepID=A0AAV2LUX3_KNICA
MRLFVNPRGFDPQTPGSPAQTRPAACTHSPGRDGTQDPPQPSPSLPVQVRPPLGAPCPRYGPYLKPRGGARFFRSPSPSAIGPSGERGSDTWRWRGEGREGGG